MDKRVIRNAQDAKEEKEKQASTTERFLDLVSMNVASGCLHFFEYMSDEVFSEISRLGFTMTRVRGQFGESIVRVEW